MRRAVNTKVFQLNELSFLQAGCLDLGMGLLYGFVLLAILGVWVKFTRQSRGTSALPELVEPLVVEGTSEDTVVVSGQDSEIIPVEVQSAVFDLCSAF